MMIMKYKLTYPSGTATAYLINNFHSPKEAKLAKKEVDVLLKSFSFVFAFYQWFFYAADGCGFSSIATFGLKAYAHDTRIRNTFKRTLACHVWRGMIRWNTSKLATFSEALTRPQIIPSHFL
ncbi:probable metal-nicotianamine transporter YSL7 isoform X2 [Malus sylvestris]|uniref:probable metal-nicotianamine transporter YSL7 isoform X2 n=1 Tax=Malus sylvestris TaxID=3752 RepID=UPI0021AD4FA8|nr:probable metal-nicotianamine transporter YSL7 isoform X2 [Malus sylvestris]